MAEVLQHWQPQCPGKKYVFRYVSMHVVSLELHLISVLESTAARALHVALAFFVQPEKAKMVENNNCVKKRRKGGGGK